jgi:hypothetical protein
MLNQPIFIVTCVATLVSPALADEATTTPEPAPGVPAAGDPAAVSTTAPRAPEARPPELHYGDAGLLRAGGSLGLMVSPDFRNVNLSPSIGWFLADDVELSGIVSLSNIKAGSESATVWAVMIEPSYHLPLGPTTWGFAGLGFGAAYESDLGAGIAVEPRIGASFLLGKAGALTPSLSYQYTTHNTAGMSLGEMRDVALTAASNALRINLGYVTMW